MSDSPDNSITKALSPYVDIILFDPRREITREELLKKALDYRLAETLDKVFPPTDLQQIIHGYIDFDKEKSVYLEGIINTQYLLADFINYYFTLPVCIVMAPNF